MREISNAPKRKGNFTRVVACPGLIRHEHASILGKKNHSSIKEISWRYVVVFPWFLILLLIFKWKYDAPIGPLNTRTLALSKIGLHLRPNYDNRSPKNQRVFRTDS